MGTYPRHAVHRYALYVLVPFCAYHDHGTVPPRMGNVYPWASERPPWSQRSRGDEAVAARDPGHQRYHVPCPLGHVRRV